MFLHDSSGHRVHDWLLSELSQKRGAGDPLSDGPLTFEVENLRHLASIQKHVEKKKVKEGALYQNKMR